MQPIFVSSGMGATPIRDFNEPEIEIEIFAPDIKIQAIYIFILAVSSGLGNIEFNHLCPSP